MMRQESRQRGKEGDPFGAPELFENDAWEVATIGRTRRRPPEARPRFAPARGPGRGAAQRHRKGGIGERTDGPLGTPQDYPGATTPKGRTEEGKGRGVEERHLGLGKARGGKFRRGRGGGVGGRETESHVDGGAPCGVWRQSRRSRSRQHCHHVRRAGPPRPRRGQKRGQSGRAQRSGNDGGRRVGEGCTHRDGGGEGGGESGAGWLEIHTTVVLASGGGPVVISTGASEDSFLAPGAVTSSSRGASGQRGHSGGHPIAEINTHSRPKEGGSRARARTEDDKGRSPDDVDDIRSRRKRVKEAASAAGGRALAPSGGAGTTPQWAALVGQATTPPLPTAVEDDGIDDSSGDGARAATWMRMRVFPRLSSKE